jgi:hypothetical protein
LNIEVIDKPFVKKESFTKETILSAKRWKSVYGKKALGMAGKWWRSIYRGRRGIVIEQILYRWL